MTNQNFWYERLSRKHDIRRVKRTGRPPVLETFNQCRRKGNCKKPNEPARFKFRMRRRSRSCRLTERIKLLSLKCLLFPLLGFSRTRSHLLHSYFGSSSDTACAMLASNKARNDLTLVSGATPNQYRRHMLIALCSILTQYTSIFLRIVGGPEIRQLGPQRCHACQETPRMPTHHEKSMCFSRRYRWSILERTFSFNCLELTCQLSLSKVSCGVHYVWISPRIPPG